VLQPACTTLSISQEQQLGEQSSRQLGGQLEFVTDAAVVRYVDGIGREIVAAAGPQPYAYRFFVVNDAELNAFALPAGYIYIHTAVVLQAQNVSELAGVVAHEVGHVAERHVAQNYNRQRNTGIVYQVFAVAASIFVGGYAAAGGQMLGQLAAVAYVNQFTREAETQADDFAIDVLPRAGYAPRGLVTFFETLKRQGGARPPTFLSSHPATEDRIAHAASRIARANLRAGLRVTDDGALEIAQRRIRMLEERAHTQ